MKRTLLTAAVGLATAAFTFSSCEQLDELTKFNVNYSTDFTVTATSTTLGSVLELVSPRMETNSEVYSQNGTNADMLESVTLQSLVLDITAPEGEDFSFLESVEIFLDDDIENGGLDEIKVAFKTDIDDATVSGILQLDVADNNLVEYLQGEAIILRMKTVTDESLENDIDIKASSTFEIDAKIII